MPQIDRLSPNPESQILPRAIIGGAGMELPPSASVPPQGMGAVLLYIKASHHLATNTKAIQDDLGLPWSSGMQAEAPLGDKTSGISTAGRVSPNSEILRNAIIGGMGMELPPWPSIPPPGMWLVLLYIPLGYVLANSMNAIQNDLGLPWHCEDGEPAWLDDELELLTTADA